LSPRYLGLEGEKVWAVANGRGWDRLNRGIGFYLQPIDGDAQKAGESNKGSPVIRVAKVCELFRPLKLDRGPGHLEFCHFALVESTLGCS